MEPSLITRMYDKDSNVLREYYVERRVWTPLERVPPRQVATFFSEVLVLGAPDADGNVVLVRPEAEVPLGVRLF